MHGKGNDDREGKHGGSGATAGVPWGLRPRPSGRSRLDADSPICACPHTDNYATATGRICSTYMHRSRCFPKIPVSRQPASVSTHGRRATWKVPWSPFVVFRRTQLRRPSGIVPDGYTSSHRDSIFQTLKSQTSGRLEKHRLAKVV